MNDNESWVLDPQNEPLTQLKCEVLNLNVSAFRYVEFFSDNDYEEALNAELEAFRSELDELLKKHSKLYAYVSITS